MRLRRMQGMRVNSPPRETPGVAERIVGLSHRLFEAASVDSTLSLVTQLAVENVPGCEHAGTSMTANGDGVRPGASTSDLARRLDEAQCEEGEGPCLDAISSRGLVPVPDLAQETRWPRFRPLAAAAGLGSILSVPLLYGDEVVGALNMYAGRPRGFDDADADFVLLYGFEGALAIGMARTHQHAALQAEQLQQALTSRDVIGQAKGIIMERERLTADQAFEVLRKASQHRNVKLRDVAEQVASTGQLP
jgi:GAF domain-containing protein